MKKSLYDLIKENDKAIRFHMPGHSGKSPSAEFNDLFSSAKFDVTELSYSDNLLFGNDVLAQLEEKISKIYSKDKTLIFTTGATSALYCAISSVNNKGNYLIIGNAHKSVYNALRTIKATAFQLNTSNEKKIFDVLQEKSIDNVIVTSPDYYGSIVKDSLLSAIKNYNENINIIIDASHGSHFAFCKKLPISNTKNADLVIHSLHKTLPVFGGGALLHTKSQLYDRAKFMRSLYHSTSPSYLVLTSISCAMDIYEISGKQIYNNIFAEIVSFNKHIIDGLAVIENDDFTRLVIQCIDYNANDVYDFLLKNSIYPEMICEDKIVFIVTQGNYIHLNNELLNCLRSLPEEFNYRKQSKAVNTVQVDDLIELVFYDEFEFIDTEKSEGRIAFTEIGLYPPGTPFIYSGQKINSFHLNLINSSRNNIFGLVNNKVCVVK